MIILSNFEDHLTLIFRLDGPLITDCIVQLNNLLVLLEKKATSFAYHNEFGYLTTNPQYSGSASLISFHLKLTQSLNILNSPEIRYDFFEIL